MDWQDKQDIKLKIAGIFILKILVIHGKNGYFC